MFDKLYEHVKLAEHDYETIRACIDQPSIIAELTSGDVTVSGSTVYHKGRPLHESVCVKLLAMLEAGFDAKPWAAFIDLLMKNPSENSRNSLYDFLAKFDAPLTEDGHFIVFKKVRDNYFDIYSGTFDNSPGKIVQMDRNSVVDDPNRHCSAGLHVCSFDYLPRFGNGVGDRIVACKVSPEDVVSVPHDYNHSKMRVCRYEVLADCGRSGVRPTGIATQTIHKPSIFDTPSETFTGNIEDAIYCENEGEFAERWALDVDAKVELHSYVVDLEADWRVGQVTGIATNAYGIVYEIEWQGEECEDVDADDGDYTVVKARSAAVFSEICQDCGSPQDGPDCRCSLCYECGEDEDYCTCGDWDDENEEDDEDSPLADLTFIPSDEPLYMYGVTEADITPPVEFKTQRITNPCREITEEFLRSEPSMSGYITIGNHRLSIKSFNMISEKFTGSEMAEHFGVSMSAVADALVKAVEQS